MNFFGAGLKIHAGADENLIINFRQERGQSRQKLQQMYWKLFNFQTLQLCN